MIINLFHQSHLQPFRLEIFLNLMLYENNSLKVELFSFFILLYNILINTFLLSFLVVNSPYLINIIFIYITHFFILYLNNIETEENIDEVVDILKNIFGIHSIVVATRVNTNNEEIEANVLEVAKNIEFNTKTRKS